MKLRLERDVAALGQPKAPCCEHDCERGELEDELKTLWDFRYRDHAEAWMLEVLGGVTLIAIGVGLLWLSALLLARAMRNGRALAKRHRASPRPAAARTPVTRRNSRPVPAAKAANAPHSRLLH